MTGTQRCIGQEKRHFVFGTSLVEDGARVRKGTGGGAQTKLFGSPDWIKAIVLVDLGLQFLYPSLPQVKIL